MVTKSPCHDSRGGCRCRDKDPRHLARYSRNNHTSDKCWDKFGKPECAQIADTSSTSTSAVTSFTAVFTVKIFIMSVSSRLLKHPN